MVLFWLAWALFIVTLVLGVAPMPPVVGIPGYALAEMTLWLGMVLLRVDSYRRAPIRYRRFYLLIDPPFFALWLGQMVWARLDPTFWHSSRAAGVVILFVFLLLGWLGAHYALLRRGWDHTNRPRREGDV